MKIKLDGYTISFSDDLLKNTNKSDWINQMLNELAWTGIPPERLEGKLTELYELVNGVE